MSARPRRRGNSSSRFRVLGSRFVFKFAVRFDVHTFDVHVFDGPTRTTNTEHSDLEPNLNTNGEARTWKRELLALVRLRKPRVRGRWRTALQALLPRRGLRGKRDVADRRLRLGLDVGLARLRAAPGRDD